MCRESGTADGSVETHGVLGGRTHHLDVRFSPNRSADLMGRHKSVRLNLTFMGKGSGTGTGKALVKRMTESEDVWYRR